jgi:hypothetical protein
MDSFFLSLSKPDACNVSSVKSLSNYFVCVCVLGAAAVNVAEEQSLSNSMPKSS